MQDKDMSVVFDQERAANYDNQYIKLAPLRDAIHLLIRLVLADLPANARILCVGVGTGSELLDLAQAFPQWQFTASDPSAPMLAVCRRRAEESGIASRCTFHEGYIDTLPQSDAFDAATSLLVSHFILQPDAQQQFFTQIASRLRPDGYLICSSLASDTSTAAYQSLLNVWLRMQQYTGAPVENVEKLREIYGRDVSMLPPSEIISRIASSGFTTPIQFYQTLLIHAWYAQRTTV